MSRKEPSLDRKILVVGANPLERRALRFIVEEMGFVFAATDIKDIQQDTEATQAADICAVVALVPNSGFANLLAEVFGSTPVIMLTKVNGGNPETYSLPDNIHAILDADFPCEKLANLIPLVMEGFYIAPSLAHRRAAHLPRNGDCEAAGLDSAAQKALLTTREMDVISRIATGSSNKEIARDLNIAVNTVNVHVNSVIRKLGVNNRTQIAIWYSTKVIGPSLSSH